MFKLVAFALVALAAVSMVNGVAIFPRKNPPAGWIADILEPYDEYHARYLAVGCQNEHNTQFFNDCCHPLKKGETLENNRKPYCRPGANPSSSLSQPPANTLVSEPSPSPAPEPSSVPDSGDDCDEDNSDENYDDGDDDCEDDNSSSYEPSSTPAVPTPSEGPEPNSTPTPTPIPTPSPSPEPSPYSSSDTPTPSSSPVQGNPSETHTGGHLTWFTQNGNAGACGQVHSDSDFIAALDTRTYGDTSVQSQYCGKTIRITWQSKSVDVVVADACPSCDNASSVDLSQGAFQALAPLSDGLLTDATWELL